MSTYLGFVLTVLLLLVEFEQSQACFFALDARVKPAELVADEAVEGLAKFLKTQSRKFV